MASPIQIVLNPENFEEAVKPVEVAVARISLRIAISNLVRTRPLSSIRLIRLPMSFLLNRKDRSAI